MGACEADTTTSVVSVAIKCVGAKEAASVEASKARVLEVSVEAVVVAAAVTVVCMRRVLPSMQATSPPRAPASK